MRCCSRDRMGTRWIRCGSKVALISHRVHGLLVMLRHHRKAEGAEVKKALLYAAGFLEVFLCAGGILGLLKVPSTMLRMGVRPFDDPSYFAGMVIANVAIIALSVWLIILTRRKLNSMKRNWAAPGPDHNTTSAVRPSE